MTTPSIRPINKVLPLLTTVQNLLIQLQAPATLAARIFVGMAFFRSGLTKIADWETTLALFADEYHVPLLSPELAAVMGTAGELVLPVLLAFAFFSNLSYALVGSLLRHWLAGPVVDGQPTGARLLVFNRGMALALVLTAGWMLLGGGGLSPGGAA